SHSRRLGGSSRSCSGTYGRYVLAIARSVVQPSRGAQHKDARVNGDYSDTLLGLIGAGLFPTDPLSRIATTAGALHVVSSLIALPPMTVGMILLSLEFGGDQRWRAIATIALTPAVVRLIPFL